MMESIVINGYERFCGLVPTPPETRKLFAPAREKIKAIPQSEWREISSRHLIDHILDQDGLGSCVAHSAVQSLMICRAREGLEYAELSGGCLYGLINGGADRGSNIGDGLTTLQEVGTCKASTIGQLDWRTSRSSTSWKAEAANYRADEAVVCDTVEEFVSGLVLGWAGNFGVAANNRFDTDSEGYMVGSGSGINHSVLASGLKKHPKNGKWYVELVNSWASSWGIGGIGYYPVDGIASNELWLIRSSIIA